MEHKPIYVDGVDVSGCKYCNLRKHHDIVSDELWEVCYSKDCKYSTCANNPNCYYKQLARKTQECEELKAYAQRQENQREEYHKEYLKKDKALEEIEGYINNQGIDNKWNMRIQRFRSGILDIINKAKGEE